MKDLPEFVLDRQFNAPRGLVWRAWTDPTHLQHWYGPGVETVIHKFELVPGGVWLNEMKMKNGSNYQKAVFKEVQVSEKLVWHHHNTDADWNIASNPMMPDWPRIVRTTVTFAENGDKTNVRLSQIPLEATEAEIACFAQMKDGMAGGWGGGYVMIDEILKQMAEG